HESADERECSLSPRFARRIARATNQGETAALAYGLRSVRLVSLSGDLLALALGLGASTAKVVEIVRVLNQPLVHLVPNLFALAANEVLAFDRLVDPLSIEDPALQLIDPDTEEVLVLALDLSAPSLVFRQVAILLSIRPILFVEDAVALLALSTSLCLSR